MKFLATFLFCCLAPIASASAQPAFPSDDADVARWMSTYYVDKDAGQIAPFLGWLEASHALDRKSIVEPSVVAFLSCVFADNSDGVRGWVASGAFTGEDKIAIERALWLSHRRELIAEVFHDTPDYVSREPPSLLTLSLKSAESIDVMWWSFFATGNVAYPERLIDVLDPASTPTGDTAANAALRETIAKSLKSNMWYHELIDRMVRREARLRTGALQDRLQSLIAGVEAERPSFPEKSGDFGAVLVLISEDNLKEFEKPTDQAVKLYELDKARPGDHIAVKIAFAGMELTDDLRADVTYDVKIVRPDGKVFEGSEQTLKALKERTPLRFAIFDSREAPIAGFRPNDPRGTYMFVVVIRDNIGHRSLSLSKQIELTD